MNAAEITDKLGLHSLRQRAWVSWVTLGTWASANSTSTFNLLALPPEMVFMKVWSGSQALSERLATSKSSAFFIQLRSFLQATLRTIESFHITILSSISVIGASGEHSRLFGSPFS